MRKGRSTGNSKTGRIANPSVILFNMKVNTPVIHELYFFGVTVTEYYDDECDTRQS